MTRRAALRSNRGFAAIGLFQPKTASNVGSVLRAASCYEASLVVIEGSRYRKAATDVTKAWRHIPLQHGTLKDSIPFGCQPVAVDLVDNASSLVTFQHPQSAYYVFGPEDGTLGKATLDWCPHVVYVPTRYCMNLAAAVNVVLYDRMAKQTRKEETEL